MIEDKLTREERIRLEALKQAVSLGIMRNLTAHLVISEAKTLERYIKGQEDV